MTHSAVVERSDSRTASDHATARFETRRLPSPPRREKPRARRGKDTTLAPVKRPSFLKRQKEQQRLARAAQKREARNARKQARRDNPGGEPIEFDPNADGVDASIAASEADGVEGEAGVEA